MIDRRLNFQVNSITNISKSLELPLIRVTLKTQNKVIATHVITPEQYLIESLVGIKRIPQNSPYPFKFVVTEPRKGFDQYQLDIIHPLKLKKIIKK